MDTPKNLSSLLNSFDAAIVAFGVRNFSNLHAGLGEMLRVLRPGGKLVVLEFFPAPRRPDETVVLSLFPGILPRIGRAISHHEHAYQYLPQPSSFFLKEKRSFRSLTPVDSLRPYKSA